MEEEIDLRRYIVVLLKYRYWIAGIAIAAALVSFGVSAFIPPTYEATILVTATQPRYQLQFDNRFQNIPEWTIQQLLQNQYRIYPTLATNDDLLQQLAAKTGWTLKELKESTQADIGETPNLLVLTIKGQEAEEIAAVANMWGELFVTTINTLYGDNGEVDRFKQQQESTAQSLAQADAALTAFREENGFGFSSSTIIVGEDNQSDWDTQFGLIGQRLQTKNKLLTDYEAELVRLRQMQHEVELLSETTTANTSPVLIAGLLSEMINTGIVKDTQAYQIKLDSVDPVAGLAIMGRALESRAAAIEIEIKTLGADIAALQAELATKQEQLEQLIREKDVTAETYQTISRKMQEAQLEAADKQPVEVAGWAVVPIEPVSPRRLLNTAIAGVLGLMLGVFGVFALEWWQEE